MTASLLQLVAIGNEDFLLHGNPQISYFKSVNLKYVNFSMERINTLPKTTVKPSLDFTSETLFEINTDNIDALGNIYLALTLPSIKSKYPFEFEWIDNLSDFIVEKADFIINSTLIDSIDSNIIHMFKQNNSNSVNSDLNDDISQNNPTIITPNYTYNDENKISRPDNMKSIEKINFNYNKFLSIKKKIIYIKLPFFFSRNEIKLPIISLRKSKLFIKLHLRPINKLFRIKTLEKVTLITNPDVAFDHTNADTFQELYYKVYYTAYSSEINLSITDFVDNLNPFYDDVSLISYCYFFDKLDVNFFKQKNDILINRYKIYNNILDKPKNQIYIENNDLVKEITIITQRNDVKLRNNYNYYGIHDYDMSNINVKKWYNYYFEICYKQYVSDIAFINLLNNSNSNIIQNIFNNMVKINEKSYIVFSYFDNKNRHQCDKYELTTNNLDTMIKYCKSESDEYHSPFLYYGMLQNKSLYDIISIKPFYFRYKLLNLNYKNETTKSLAYLPKIYSNNNTIFLYFDQPTYTDSILTENLFIEQVNVITEENILALLNQWNRRHFKKIPYVYDENNKYFNSQHSILSLDLKYRGNSIINRLDEHNIYKTNLFNHYSSKINIDNIVKIPFSIEPDKYSPTGHLNFENIERLLVEIEIKDIFNNDELIEDKKIMIDFYLSTINILIINDNDVNLLI